MKLSRLERAILKKIDRQYPKAWDSAESEKKIAMHESCLSTKRDLEDVFKKYAIADIENALGRLIGFQCVCKRCLLGQSDYVDLQLAPGKSIRSLVASPGNGIDGYQVTSYGKETIQSFRGTRIKKLLKEFGAKLFDHILRAVIPFLLGMLFSSYFGFDFKNLSWHKEAKDPAAVPSKVNRLTPVIEKQP